jgi:hypothetical protein
MRFIQSFYSKFYAELCGRLESRIRFAKIKKKYKKDKKTNFFFKLKSDQTKIPNKLKYDTYLRASNYPEKMVEEKNSLENNLGPKIPYKNPIFPQKSQDPKVGKI